VFPTAELEPEVSEVSEVSEENLLSAVKSLAVWIFKYKFNLEGCVQEVKLK
jgi:hypothetical protein